jgi:hypothetical protein
MGSQSAVIARRIKSITSTKPMTVTGVRKIRRKALSLAERIRIDSAVLITLALRVLHPPTHGPAV